MQKFIKTIFVITVIAACLSLPAKAAAVIGINDLVEEAIGYNGKTVTVEGEAIGEVLERGDYSWVNINDGSNAIGIWLKTEDAKRITRFGDYKHIGDVLRISGTFSRDCPEHGGDVDIHCTSFEIIREGYSVKEDVSIGKIYFAAILFITASAAALLYFLHGRGRTVSDTSKAD